MKKLRLLAAVVMAAGTIFVLDGCKDPCKDVSCLNEGTCNEGVCECTTGYTGDDCGTEERAAFLGTYSVSDDCDANPYTSTISKSSSGVTKILISNMANVFSNNVTATVSGSTLTIDNQEPDGDSWFVTGSGTVSGSDITLDYTVTDPASTEFDCKTTYTAQ